MRHHRSPTHSYPHNFNSPLSVHATLALRHPSIPTLLSPLRSISNTPPCAIDDFQSNACLSLQSYLPPLAGLGITYLRDASPNLDDYSLAPQDPALQMQVDGVQAFPTEISLHDFCAPTVPYGPLEPKEDRYFVPGTALGCEPTGHVEPGFDSDIDSTASDTIGLIPDVNMYDDLRRMDMPRPGVNPLDTIRGTPLHDIGISYGQPASPEPMDKHIDDIFSTMDSRVQQSPSPRVIQDIMSILVRPAPEFSFLPRPSTNSPTAQGFSPPRPAAPRSPIPIKLEPPGVPDSEHCPVSAPWSLEYPNTTHLSPVLNAHLGIELSELVSRAECFRTKYPERDIDRAWLSHFAGKLSDRGELLNDFRCYVVGCDQRNKRRDHILVHVGAHIGQRPFACSVCPLRFLRKNECKRHEASHSGSRPYSCNICGQSFVRQDLVKRHVKRTHGLRDENQSGGMKQTRKKAR